MAVESPARVDIPPPPQPNGAEIPRPSGASLDVPSRKGYGGYDTVMKRVYIGPPGEGSPENVIVTLSGKSRLPLIDKRLPWIRQSVLQRDDVEPQPPKVAQTPSETVTAPVDTESRFQEQQIWSKYDQGKTGIITWIGRRNPRSAARANEETLLAMVEGKIPVPDATVAAIVDKYRVSKIDGRRAFADYYNNIAS